MRLSLAAAFLAQALPNLVLGSDPKFDVNRGIKHEIPPKSLPSDIKTTFRNVSSVKEVRPLKNVKPLKNAHVVEESRMSRSHQQQPSDMIDVDVGILGFGHQEYGMGDLSSTIEIMAKRRRRSSYEDSLFPPPSVCDPNNSEYAQMTNCDCTDFDFEDRLGTFSCTSQQDICLHDAFCGFEEITNSIYHDGSVRSDHCYHFDNTNNPDEDYSEVCYSQILSMQDQEETCGIFVNGELCNSCQVRDTDCHEFDCSNTDANVAGTNCGDEDILSALLQHHQQQQASPIHDIMDPSRPLLPPPSVCDINSSAYGTYNCDCSYFDSDTNQGSFGCITQENFCLGNDDEFCGYNTITNTISEDGEVHTHFCYYIDDEPDHPMNVCYSTYGNDHDACSIHVQGVECKSCQVVDGVMDNDGNIEDGCTSFDCSNTIARVEGMDCKGDYIFDAIIKNKGTKGSRMASSHAASVTQQSEAMILKPRVLASGFTYIIKSTETKQGSTRMASNTASEETQQSEAMILKSRVLASGFALKAEANNTSTSPMPHSGPL